MHGRLNRRIVAVMLVEGLFVVVGFLIGCAGGWLLAVARTRAVLVPAIRDAEGRARAAEAAADARIEEVRRGMGEQRALLAESKAALADTFQALAAQALQQSGEGFLLLASERLDALRREAALDLETRQRAIEGLVRPVKESLEKVDRQIVAIEKERGQAYGTLAEQVRSLAATHERLRDETGNLVKALRAPAVRGRWGEIQLKRVVEIAGMLEHCDFAQQVTIATDEGSLRPDLVVRLPGGRNVVVDAKVPLAAYLEAHEADDDATRAARLRDHAAQVRAHIHKLAAKSYWERLSPTPEFVVMFLPGEPLYGAALEQAPSLIEEGVAQRVLLATPTTLIALLQAVCFGWRQERIADSAQKISEQGRALHDRVATLIEHLNRLGGSLERSMEHFNAAMASVEGRVLPAARKLGELGAAGKKDLADGVHLDGRPRLLARAAGAPEGETEPPELDA